MTRPALPSAAPASAAEAVTEAEVENRIYEAVDTLKRLPVPDIQRSVTRWPDVLRDSHEAYGYDAVHLRLAPAAPDAITRLDETLQWLRWLPRAAQRILWSRANGFSWRRIAAYVGKAPNTCRAWYLAGLHHIAAQVNDGAPPARPGAAPPPA